MINARLVIWCDDAPRRKKGLRVAPGIRGATGFTISYRGAHELVVVKSMHEEYGSPIDLMAQMTDVVARAWRSAFDETPPLGKTTISARTRRAS